MTHIIAEREREREAFRCSLHYIVQEKNIHMGKYLSLNSVTLNK